MTEIWSLSSICRCCHSDGTFKSLYLSYKVKGQMEQYAVMLKETFDIVMDPAPPNASTMICDDCIYELKKATRFKEQVLDCERKFVEYCLNEQTNHTDVKIESEFEDDSVDHDNTNEWPNTDDYRMEEANEIEPKEEIKKDVESVVQKNEKQTDNERDTKAKKGVKAKDKTKTTKSKPTDPLIVQIGSDSSKSFASKQGGERFDKPKKSKTSRDMRKCHFCDEEFPTIRLRSAHSITHFANNKFECHVCGKTYTKLVGLKIHFNEHTKRRIFICDYCNKEFVQKSTLRKHILIHAGTRVRLVCDLCGVQCNDNTQLRIHTNTVHEKLKPYGCQECEKSFAAKKNLKCHVMAKHTGDMPYECEVCTRQFPSLGGLKRHQNSHNKRVATRKTQHTQKDFTCPHCEAEFESKSLYLSHRRSFVHLHLNKKILEKNLKCEYCDRIFEKKYAYNRHVMNLHLGDPSFSCEICDRKFPDKSTVARHMRRHQPSGDKQTCTLCLRKVRSMEKHMKAHTEKAYECRYCNKKYPENNTLTRHIKTKHLKIGTHFCPLCPAKFIRPDGLKQHLKKKHNGVEIKEPPPPEVDLEQIQSFKIKKV